jgi:3-oxoacyl-[acyl-carrier-protein] synthase I
MKKNRVFISSFASITALGTKSEEIIANLEKGKQLLSYPEPDSKLKYPYFSIKSIPHVDIEKTRSSQITFFLLKSIEEKIKNYKSIPLFLATSTGGIKETEEVYKDIYEGKLVYPIFKRHFFNQTISDIKEKYKDKFSEIFTFSTACSSSGHSILQAFRFIREGIIDKAVIIGVDTISLTTMIGFDSLKLVSHTNTRPLTKSRDGLSLGEGGGILILEANPKEPPDAEILGCSSNSDGYHISSPDPEGETQKKLILDVLDEAEISPEKIDYINAHGTGTPMNDEIEMKAVRSVFPKGTTITSLKSFIGHTLGASASAEIAIALEMIKKGKIYQPEDFNGSMDENYIPDKTIQKKVDYFIKNSFGFGGNNVSIIAKMLIG